MLLASGLCGVRSPDVRAGLHGVATLDRPDRPALLEDVIVRLARLDATAAHAWTAGVLGSRIRMRDSQGWV